MPHARPRRALGCGAGFCSRLVKEPSGKVDPGDRQRHTGAFGVGAEFVERRTGAVQNTQRARQLTELEVRSPLVRSALGGPQAIAGTGERVARLAQGDQRLTRTAQLQQLDAPVGERLGRLLDHAERSVGGFGAGVRVERTLVVSEEPVGHAEVAERRGAQPPAQVLIAGLNVVERPQQRSPDLCRLGVTAEIVQQLHAPEVGAQRVQRLAGLQPARPGRVDEPQRLVELAPLGAQPGTLVARPRPQPGQPEELRRCLAAFGEPLRRGRLIVNQPLRLVQEPLNPVLVGEALRP